MKNAEQSKLIDCIKKLSLLAIEWRDYCVREAESFDHPAQQQERQMCIENARVATKQIEAADELLKQLGE